MRRKEGGAFSFSVHSRCRVIHYCVAECRKEDWANHKHECPFLTRKTHCVRSWICRLMARIILKLRRTEVGIQRTRLSRSHGLQPTMSTLRLERNSSQTTRSFSCQFIEKLFQTILQLENIIMAARVLDYI